MVQKEGGRSTAGSYDTPLNPLSLAHELPAEGTDKAERKTSPLACKVEGCERGAEGCVIPRTYSTNI